MGEAGAIVGGHIDRNELRKELYVPTIEDQAVQDFFVDDYREDGSLLVITGSAGDGKSALLSRAFKRAMDADKPVDESHIRMDATAADTKHETYDVALNRFLRKRARNAERQRGPRSGLAINLGLAIDFFDRQGYADQYPGLWEAIDAVRTKREYKTENVHAINLGHRRLYETRPDELGEGLLREIVEKFAFDSPASPFHEAFEREKDQCPAGEKCPLHYNASQFTKETVRERVAKLLATSGVVNTTYLNPRSILDHVTSMILPRSLQELAVEGACPVGAGIRGNPVPPESLLWNTIFERLDDPSDPGAGQLDPAASSSVSLDQILLSWGAAPDRVSTLLGETPLGSRVETATRIRTALRRLYLVDEQRIEAPIETALESPQFDEFLGALTYLNQEPSTVEDDTELQQYVTDVLRTVQASLQGWSGSITDDDYIEFVDGIKSTDYRFLSKWSKPDPDRAASHRQTQQETTPGQLWLVLKPEGTDVTVPVPVTFELYQLMTRIRDGYNPNALDLERSEGMRLIQSRLSEFTNKQEQVRVVNKLDTELFRVEEGGFDTIEIKSGEQL
ncbi:DNA phosphorothioation-dependent restriction protein DptF [Halorubellus litoreus]